MIATSSSGRRFAPLARYLLRGRSGEEATRVAWTAGRNLGTDDPNVAAALMQATAAQNVRVKSPVYHLTLNFDPTDVVTPEQMQAVADRVLSDLGLAEHQAVFVAHQDRAHPHVHVMVNRVHPHTGAAWDRWQDQPKIQRALRELERTLGLQEVAGRLYQLEGQAAPERALLTNGEQRQAERTGGLAFPDHVRAQIAEFRAARSWAELDERLRKEGLRFERKGQGLVVTDGEHQVKASRVARDLSLGQLEKRFGVAYPEQDHTERTVPADRQRANPAVERVRRALGEHERAAALGTEQRHAEQELAIARERLRQLTAATERVQHASQQFDAALARVYRDPPAARASFAHTSAERGAENAAAILRAEPERFGALQTVERPRALGLLVTHDDTRARAAVPGAAFRAQVLREAELAAASVERDDAQRPGPSVEPPTRGRDATLESLRAQAAEVVARLQARLRRLQHAISHEPSAAVLQRGIHRLVDRLEPDELRQLGRVLTTPQAAIAFRVRESVKDIVLGREEREQER